MMDRTSFHALLDGVSRIWRWRWRKEGREIVERGGLTYEQDACFGDEDIPGWRNRL
jgi:hypothetical protein